VKPSASVASQSFPNDETQVLKNFCIIEFINCMLHHQMKPQNELTLLLHYFCHYKMSMLHKYI
jgi:hypothetical protein